MSDINTRLESATKAGRVHPKTVLDLVVDQIPGARSVEVLLNPALSSDDELTGARAIAFYLLSDRLMSDLSPADIATLFEKPEKVVSHLIEQIRQLMARDIATKEKILGLRAKLSASPVAAPVPPAPSAPRAPAPAPAPSPTPALPPRALVPAVRNVHTETQRRGETTMSTAKREGKEGSSRRYTTIKPADRQAAMLEILEQFGSISPGKLGAELRKRRMDLSNATIRLDMEALMREHKRRVIVDGERASRRYIIDGRVESGEADSSTRRAKPQGAAPDKSKRGRARTKVTPTLTPAPAPAPAPAAPPPSGGSMASALALLSRSVSLVQNGNGQPLVQLTPHGVAVTLEAGMKMVDNFRACFVAALAGEGSVQAAEEAAFVATVFLRGAAGTIPPTPVTPEPIVPPAREKRR